MQVSYSDLKSVNQTLAVLIEAPLAIARVLLCISSVCLFVCYTKMLFCQKLISLELWSVLMIYRKSYMGFSKKPLLDP